MSLNPLRPISIGQESLPSPLPWDSTARFCDSSSCCMNESPRQTLNVPGVEPWREGGVISWLPQKGLSSLHLKQSRSTKPYPSQSVLYSTTHGCVCVCVCIHAFHQFTSYAWWVKMSHPLRFSMWICCITPMKTMLKFQHAHFFYFLPIIVLYANHWCSSFHRLHLCA